MKQDVEPLFHIKQSKNMRCFVSKKINSTEKRIFFNPKYIFNEKSHQKIEKKNSFGMFQLKRPFEYKRQQ